MAYARILQLHGSSSVAQMLRVVFTVRRFLFLFCVLLFCYKMQTMALA